MRWPCWLFTAVIVFPSDAFVVTTTQSDQQTGELDAESVFPMRAGLSGVLIPVLFKSSWAVGLIPMNKLHVAFCFPWFPWNLQAIVLEHYRTLDSCSFLSCTELLHKKTCFLLQPEIKSIKDAEFLFTCSKILILFLYFSSTTMLIPMLWECKKWYSLNKWLWVFCSQHLN